MTEPASAPEQAPPPYSRAEAWVFQAWLIMFLGVVCGALALYLMSFVAL